MSVALRREGVWCNLFLNTEFKVDHLYSGSSIILKIGNNVPLLFLLLPLKTVLVDSEVGRRLFSLAGPPSDISWETCQQRWLCLSLLLPSCWEGESRLGNHFLSTIGYSWWSLKLHLSGLHFYSTTATFFFKCYFYKLEAIKKHAYLEHGYFYFY